VVFINIIESMTLEKTHSAERGTYFEEAPKKGKTKQKNYAGKLETPSKMAKYPLLGWLA
jgi:hypothetical protein